MIKINEHIKRRFNNEIHITPEIKKQSSRIFSYKNGINKDNLKSIFKNKREKFTYLETPDNTLIESIKHTINGQKLIIPIPDPTIVYYSYVQDIINTSAEIDKKELIKKCIIDTTKKYIQTEDGKTEIYRFLASLNSIVFFLFASIESFTYQQIPDNYKFRVQERKFIFFKSYKTLNKKQIPKKLKFDRIVKDVLTDIKGLNFFNDKPIESQIIWELRDFRHRIVHTKNEGKFHKYDELIKKALDYDYKKAWLTVGNFMNYYKPGYIETCLCGNNYYQKKKKEKKSH